MAGIGPEKTRQTLAANKLSKEKFKTFTFGDVKHSVIMADLQPLSWLYAIGNC